MPRRRTTDNIDAKVNGSTKEDPVDLDTIANENAVEGGIHPAEEDEYWRANFSTRPYVDPDKADYDRYASAYEFGWQSYRSMGKAGDGTNAYFDDVEADLGLAWEDTHDANTFSWVSARPAVRDAWNRAGEAAIMAQVLGKPR